jgi:large subunit ribosomal protein L23
MALFSKKENKKDSKDDVAVENAAETAETTATTDTVVTETTPVTIKLDSRASRGLVVPRLSEKAGKLNQLNKYVFTIWGRGNKIQVRQEVERLYGVKVANVNMIIMAGKTRRFGRRLGVTQSFKKAVVTLTPDSKKIDLVEPS